PGALGETLLLAMAAAHRHHEHLRLPARLLPADERRAEREMVAPDDEDGFGALADVRPGEEAAGLEPGARSAPHQRNPEAERRFEGVTLPEASALLLVEARPEPERQRVEGEIEDCGTALPVLGPARQKERPEIDAGPEPARRIEPGSETVGVR